MIGANRSAFLVFSSRALSTGLVSVILAGCASQPQTAIIRWGEVAQQSPQPDNQWGLYLILFIAGMAAREALWRIYPHTKSRISHIRVVSRATTQPIALHDDRQFLRWRWAMRSFIAAGEHCETLIDARGRKRKPFNVRAMQEITSLSARQQAKFKSILIEGVALAGESGRTVHKPVIEVRASDGAVWLMSTGQRRAACDSLNYPKDADPPRFKLLGVDVWFEHGAHH